MRKTKQKEISGNTYIVQMWGARKAALTKVYILNLIAKNVKGIDLDGATNEEAGIKVLMGILSAIDETKADTLIDRILQGVSVNTGDEHAELLDVMDDLLAGKISDLYKILYFVLEVNYPDFLGEEGLAGKFITKLKPSPSKIDG